MSGTDANLRCFFTIAGDFPKIVPNFLLKGRNVSTPRIGRGAGAYLVEFIAFRRFLVLTKNTLEGTNGCRPIQVCRFNVLVFEFCNQAFYVDAISLDLKLLTLCIDRRAFPIDFEELDYRDKFLRFGIGLLIKDFQAGNAMAQLKKAKCCFCLF